MYIIKVRTETDSVILSKVNIYVSVSRDSIRKLDLHACIPWKVIWKIYLAAPIDRNNYMSSLRRETKSKKRKEILISTKKKCMYCKWEIVPAELPISRNSTWLPRLIESFLYTMGFVYLWIDIWAMILYWKGWSLDYYVLCGFLYTWRYERSCWILLKLDLSFFICYS